MSAMLPPIPGSQPQQFDPSAMMGQPQAPERQIAATSSIIRQIIQQLGQLAQEAPEAQQQFETAAKALTEASLLIISAQQPPQQQVPMTAA